MATIGFFDGVHRGHRFLIQELCAVAKRKGLPSAVITFAHHPRMVLEADYRPKLINSFAEKLEQLDSTGVDYCIVLPFTPALSRLTASHFMHTILAERLKVSTLLVGYDHRFGSDRTDGFEQYVAYGAQCGIEVLQALAYTEGESAASSSQVRRLLLEGRVDEVTHLLTYPYHLRGHVVSGFKVGRTLGFPTANIRVDEPYKVIPGMGVYAVHVYLKGFRYGGMGYIGSRPTLDNGEDVTVEVNIFDFSGDIYSDQIAVSFLHFVRPDAKFDSLEELQEQLELDRITVKQLLLLDNE